MSSIPTNVILIWNSTNASIPSGWQRETALDGKYPKAWGDEDPNTSGGSNTHSHTASAHAHTMDSHSHDVTTTHNASPSNFSNRADNCIDNHDHGTFALAGVSGGSLSSEVITWASGNAEPPYHEVIFIKPPSGYAAIANGIIALWNSATAPDNWTNCDGTGSTPNLSNRYIKGAGTGADAGTQTGATVHQHSVTHGHTVASHSHSGQTGNPSSTPRRGDGGSQVATPLSHSHNLSLPAASGTVSNYTNTTAGNTDTVEPEYMKTNFIQNTSGGFAPVKKGMIGLWLGTTDSIPTGWDLCDGGNGTPDLRNKFIKCINADGEVGDTGGSNTHTHTSVTHTHVATGTHTHSAGGATAGPNSSRGADSGGDGAGHSTHTHPISAVSSTTATFANATLDSGVAVSNQPAYLTAAYIQYQFAIGGGVLLGMI